MKILFKGLGPNDTISYRGKIYRNGSALTMPDEFAKAYINSHLAAEIKTAADEADITAAQRLEEKNALRRKAVQEKARQKKGGE